MDFLLEDSFPRPLVALAGNPNTGKSTIFNALTGMKQHTGNWPGKTVSLARGTFYHKNVRFNIVDLPGTYSLLANSLEEQVARNFILFNRPDVMLVVTDATCLERNLNLVLQIMEITDRIIVCVNLIDEATKKGIYVDSDVLSEELGVPVVATAARRGIGLYELKEMILKVYSGEIKPSPRKVNYGEELEKAIGELVPRLEKTFSDGINPRWLALNIISGDYSIEDIKKLIKVRDKNRGGNAYGYSYFSTVPRNRELR
ncbi:FeoB small GTPase domain-containing protein [Thermosediminibacter oceani]|uniref:FeoB small GTPase domain-containing protein n=1 Tax=Thermosediminibacter oceani TaxID=291990 RepID=UPI000315D060|nr:FeoB small GTPase domain-containing protein [Thermosediminibacter oceani]